MKCSPNFMETQVSLQRSERTAAALYSQKRLYKTTAKIKLWEILLLKRQSNCNRPTL
jgi:hypothetical protein